MIDQHLLEDLPDPAGTAMISNGVLWDVNLLFNINVFGDPRYSEYAVPPEPSPWEIAYILIRLATYAEALVFFDRIVYIMDMGVKIPLHAHLDTYTKENPLCHLFGRKGPPFVFDITSHRNGELIDLVSQLMFPLRGFRGLFRTSKAYRGYDDPLAAPDYTSQFVMHYWASTQLPYDFYANPFESTFASYDAVKQNLSLTSTYEQTNVALRVAMSVLEGWRHPGLREVGALGSGALGSDHAKWLKTC